MLRIYPVMLDAMRSIRPLLARLERRDADLTRQLRRAAASIVLNTAEGMYSRGRNRAARYHTALGSARETLACIEVAEAMHGIEIDAALVRQLDIIIGTLVRLAA
jgi:four helix bundle protein